MKQIALVTLWCFITLTIFAQVCYRFDNAQEPIVSSLACLVVFISAFIAIKVFKQPASKTALTYAISMLVMDMTVRLLEGFSDSLFCIFRPVYEVAGVWLAWLLSIKRWKTILPLITVLGIGTYLLQTRWMGPYMHYLSFHSTDGRSTKPAPKQWSMYTETGDTISNETVHDKVVILDFWYTGCGACFRKFPTLQKLYDSLRSDKQVALYAVNIPWKRDTANIAFHMIRGKKYSFPVAVGNQDMVKHFGIEYYPTIVVMKQGQIRFFGSIDVLMPQLSAIISPR